MRPFDDDDAFYLFCKAWITPGFLYHMNHPMYVFSLYMFSTYVFSLIDYATFCVDNPGFSVYVFSLYVFYTCVLYD